MCRERPSRHEVEDVLVSEYALGFRKREESATRLLEANQCELPAEGVSDQITAAPAQLAAHAELQAILMEIADDGRLEVVTRLAIEVRQRMLIAVETNAVSLTDPLGRVKLKPGFAWAKRSSVPPPSLTAMPSR